MKTKKAHSSVHNIKIASPCTVSWDSMTGDERTRFCNQCKLDVFNLAEMTMDEIDALIGDKQGRVCVRLFRRQDGTILTKDCPVGLAKVRARLLGTWAAACAIVSVLVTGILNFRSQPGTESLWQQITEGPRREREAIMGGAMYHEQRGEAMPVVTEKPRMGKLDHSRSPHANEAPPKKLVKP